MSDTPLSQMPPEQEPENKLTSEQFDEFKQALEVLYVIANMSGRLNFTKAWPDAAKHILGDELMKYDEEGTDDKEHRAELEQQAEERRLLLLDLMDTLEEKSVDKGALQVEYVSDVIESLGRELALHIYGSQIVDRFIAPPPSSEKDSAEDGADEAAGGEAAALSSNAPPTEPQQQPVAPEVPQQPPMPQTEVPAANVPLDSMDDVKPIDMSAPAEPPAGAQPETPQEPKKVEGNVEMTFVSSKDKKEPGEGSPPPSE